jgi:hypothetical protein
VQAHNQALFQLFLCDPINGIKVELNFAAEEARRAGRRPTRTAADTAHEHPPPPAEPPSHLARSGDHSTRRDRLRDRWSARSSTWRT